MNLDPSEFVVFGSGPLLAHGVRNIGDLDIVARSTAWHRALHLGRHLRAPLDNALMARITEDGGTNGGIDVTAGWLGLDGADIERLFSDAVVFEGIKFASIAAVARYKRRLSRKKDHDDLAHLHTLRERVTLTRTVPQPETTKLDVNAFITVNLLIPASASPGEAPNHDIEFTYA